MVSTFSEEFKRKCMKEFDEETPICESTMISTMLQEENLRNPIAGLMGLARMNEIREENELHSGREVFYHNQSYLLL